MRNVAPELDLVILVIGAEEARRSASIQVDDPHAMTAGGPDHLFRPVCAFATVEINRHVLRSVALQHGGGGDVGLAVAIDVGDLDIGADFAGGVDDVFGPARILIPDEPAAAPTANEQLGPAISVEVGGTLAPDA